MLTHDEEGSPIVKLIDLGIAKAVDRSGDMTATGVFLGKLKYASPEQYGTLAAGERARRPQRSLRPGRRSLRAADRRPSVRRGVAGGAAAGAPLHPAAPFSESDSEGNVPPELRAVILKALEKKREDRYGSAEEFDREIVSLRERFARPEDIERTMLRLSMIRSTQPAGPENVTPSVQDRLNRQFGPLTTPSPSAPSLKVVPGSSGEKTAIDPRSGAERAAPAPPASPPPRPAARNRPGRPKGPRRPGSTRSSPRSELRRQKGRRESGWPDCPGWGKIPESGSSEAPPPARPADRPPLAPHPAGPEPPENDATKTQVVPAEKPGGGQQQPSTPASAKAPPGPGKPQPASAGPAGVTKPKPADLPKAPPPPLPKRPAAVEAEQTVATPRIGAAPPVQAAAKSQATSPETAAAPRAPRRRRLRLWAVLAAAVAALLIWHPWTARSPAVEEVAAGPSIAPTQAAPAEVAPTAPPVPSPAPTLRPTAAPTAAPPTARPAKAPESSPLRQAAESARQATLSARQASEQARARELAPSTYRRGLARQAEGEKLLAQEADREAKAAFDAAARLFAQSEAAAKTAALPAPTAVRVAELPTAMVRPSPVPVLPTAVPQPTAPPPTAVRLEATRAPLVERQAASAAPAPAVKGNPVEEEKIREMMRSYERAWSTFDARLYARVYPAGVDAFELALKNLRSQYVRIEIQRIEVDPSGSRARVIGRETIVATPKAGNQVQNEQNVTLHVEKQSDRWVITGRD